MDHELYTEWLQLSVYGELDADKQSMLDAHIQSCSDCRRERDELASMLRSIDESGAGEPTDEQLNVARQRLSKTLWGLESEGAAAQARPPRRVSWLERWLGFGRGGSVFGYRVAMAGAATLAIGFFAGYITFGKATPVTTATSQRPDLVTAQELPQGEEMFTDVSNVYFLDANSADGQVELQYDEVRPMRIKAGVDDERVRKLLAHAILSGDNPGLRLQAINLLGLDNAVTPTDEIKQALIGALVSDSNAGVRRQAFLALQKFPFDDDIREALMFVLDHDDNPGIRMAAMDYMTARILEGEDSESAYFDILDSGRR